MYETFATCLPFGFIAGEFSEVTISHFIYFVVKLKQYYEMSWERKIFAFHFFSSNTYVNDPCCQRIISPQCIRAGYFA